MRALLVAALACGVALAGCSGGGNAAEAALPTGERPELAVGKGAIQGLLVDDRYRPLLLVDDPDAEFEVQGFILLVETGQQLRTDGEGVFLAVDLEPGVYTLRPAVEGHEGVPVKLDVVAGEFSEIDLLVRRIIEPGSNDVKVQDDTVLITCSVQTLDGHFSFSRTCHGDFSDEGDNNFVDYNYTDFGPVAAVIVEARLERVRDFEIWLTRQTNLIDSPNLYGKVYGYDSDYIRVAALNGTEVGRFGGSTLDTADLRVWANVNGPGTQEFDDLTGLPIGADLTFAEEVRIVVSAFRTIPPDFETYALLDG